MNGFGNEWTDRLDGLSDFEFPTGKKIIIGNFLGKSTFTF